MKWNVRAARLPDAQRLVEFNLAIACETEGKELSPAIVERGVCRGLQQGDEVSYWVAELATTTTEQVAMPRELIGCLMLTREWSDWRDGWLMWVQSVYVCEQYRGQGVFRSLLETVIENLRQMPDVVGVRLYVEGENERAQAVYFKTGFVDPNYKVLEQIF